MVETAAVYVVDDDDAVRDSLAFLLEAAGLTVIMDRCPKIEYGRLCGENSWAGINSGRIGSKKPQPAPGFQHFRLPEQD